RACPAGWPWSRRLPPECCLAWRWPGSCAARRAATACPPGTGSDPGGASAAQRFGHDRRQHPGRAVDIGAVVLRRERLGRRVVLAEPEPAPALAGQRAAPPAAGIARL